jgi:hypothetical protein
MAPIEEVEDLPSTDRGAGGFGSTGTAQAGSKRPLSSSDEGAKL